MRNVQYISTDNKSAIDGATGEEFVVEETVSHQDKEAGTATITGFSVREDGDVVVHTDKGQATLPFLEKLTKGTAK